MVTLGISVCSRFTSGRVVGVPARSAQLLLRALALVAFCGPAVLPAVAATPERRHVDARTGMLEVPLEELTAAIRKKDRAEIGRVAELIGPARLAQGLRRSDTPSVLAALTGITALTGRVRLIGPVTELLATAGPPIAVTAARTLGELLAPGPLPEFDEWEVPPDVAEAACVLLRSGAILPHNPTTLRLASMEALADASSVCAPTPDMVALLRDPTPVIRRAAALMLRPQELLATGGFASGTRDIDKGVAAASVAAVCELSAFSGGGVRAAGAREPIWEQTRQIARRMVVAADTSADDAVQMLDCLDPTLASDRQILDSLRTRHRSPVADRASEIVGQAQGRARP